ncbi:MAG: Crp/Fnr family transcriptional regulator [Acetobacteraceae bacterium]|nr:Crp/Fnr family transcriptional regulator [Acetobacteraceae bacterium]
MVVRGLSGSPRGYQQDEKKSGESHDGLLDRIASCHPATSPDMIVIMLSAMETGLRAMPSRTHVFGPGRHLFHLGDPVEVVHWVQSGMVLLARHQQDGSPLVLQKAGPGSILAEASIYADAYHCDAIASAPTRTLAFAKAEFIEHLRTRPAFAEAWAQYLAHELLRTRRQAEILSLKTVAKRLDAWIAWRDGGPPRKGEGITIAAEIGVSPEALYREIARRRAVS